MENKKIAIVGSRTFNDYNTLKKFIIETCTANNISIEAVISGGAKGADFCGSMFAKEYNYPLIEFKADWAKYGRKAGPMRNVDIIKNCDICFAFWDGESHGTAHDIRLCSEQNKPCFIYRFK